MVSCVHHQSQIRADVSSDVNKTFECVTITDSKFSNRVLEWMKPKSTSISRVTIWLEELDFCLNKCKWELPDQHIANWVLPPELFFNILIISAVCSRLMTCPTKLLDNYKFLISEEPDSFWVPTLWMHWLDQHTYCFHCVVCNGMRSGICIIYLQECLKSSYRGCN